MDTLVATRNLANEKNTAQLNVDQSIQRISSRANLTEFVLPQMVLYGEVNLAAIKPLGITSIVSKEPGEITELRGLPDSLTNLEFHGHLLVALPQLPKTIETLNLNRNYIEKIDVSNLPRLKVLKLNNNRLKILGELPSTLEELYVDNNQISRLDLDGLDRLRVLHCRNNRALRIENIPASMVDLQVEEGNPRVVLDYAFIPGTSTSEDDRRIRGTEAEYVESLHDYFELKRKYEEAAKGTRAQVKALALRKGLSQKQAIKRANSTKPKCVNCKRPVGTIFKMRDERLIAYCGDLSQPCDLRIEIFKGRFESDDDFAKYTELRLSETKEKIIRQKMDVLFNYVSEESAVQKFKDAIEEYNLYSFLHKTDIDMRDNKRFNAHKKELIKGKIQLLSELKAAMNVHMDEYADSGNRDFLRAAMDVYVREYLPEIHNLRVLKYSVMEMKIPVGEYEDSSVRSLIQSAASLRELEILHGEVPRVLKFVVGKSTTPAVDEVVDEPEEDASVV
jgi:hypothetical protein